MQLFLTILADDILPIFLIAGVGFALARRYRVDVRVLSRVTFNALAPCLVFNLIVTSQLRADELVRIVAFTLALVSVLGIVARLVAVPFRLSRPELAGFLIVVMFANAGNYGLSVVLFAFGRDVLARAVVYFVTSALLMYSLGVVVASSGRSGTRRAVLGLLTVPTMWALVAAAMVLWTGIRVPTGVERPIELLGSAAIPCMLLVLGMQLERSEWPDRPGLVAAAAALTLVFAPLAGYGLASLLGLTGAARQAVIVESAMPSAVITTILALEFDVAPTFVTAVVVVTTALSPLTVSLIIALLQSGY
jgi:predicted permease